VVKLALAAPTQVGRGDAQMTGASQRTRRAGPESAVARATLCSSLLIVVALTSAACGTSAAITASSRRVILTVTSPESRYERTAADTVTLRGIVVPPEAHVEIQGKRVPSPTGLFAWRESLTGPADTFLIVARAPGLAPATATVVVVRANPGSPGYVRGPHGASVAAGPAAPVSGTAVTVPKRAQSPRSNAQRRAGAGTGTRTGGPSGAPASGSTPAVTTTVETSVPNHTAERHGVAEPHVAAEHEAERHEEAAEPAAPVPTAPPPTTR
jgi:hypothetical protein